MNIEFPLRRSGDSGAQYDPKKQRLRNGVAMVGHCSSETVLLAPSERSRAFPCEDLSICDMIRRWISESDKPTAESLYLGRIEDGFNQWAVAVDKAQAAPSVQGPPTSLEDILSGLCKDGPSNRLTRVEIVCLARMLATSVM